MEITKNKPNNSQKTTKKTIKINQKKPFTVTTPIYKTTKPLLRVGELVIQVIKLKPGSINVHQNGREHRRRQPEHRRLKHRRNQRQILALYIQPLVQLNGLPLQVEVHLEEVVLEERKDVRAEVGVALKGALQVVRHFLDAGHCRPLRKVDSLHSTGPRNFELL